MAKIITMKEAADLFEDGDIILGVSFGSSGWPSELGKAIEKRFLETGHPKSMTHVHAAGCMAASCFAHEGMLSLDISSHESTTPEIAAMIQDNSLPAWYMPLGTMLQLYREQGRGMKGVLSKVGLGTFMDARVDGGCLNQAAREYTEMLKKDCKEFIRYIPDFDGEEYLYYRGLPYTKGIMRATTADEHGNITCENEVYNLELSIVARAVKAYGGKVIVQVERIAKAGTLNPKLVKLGMNLVDYVVVCEHPEEVLHGLHKKMPKAGYWDGLSGNIKVPVGSSLEKMPLDPKKIIVRRTAMEAQRGWMCNFGIGMPTFLGSIMAEEGVMNDITMISESGSVGGVPGGGPDFGCHWNVEWAADQCEHFDWFDGTGLDFGVFGLSEAQEDGSINTSFLNGVTLGVGGFANITAGANIAIFIGTFTAKGLKEKIENGKLVIEQEGQLKKFVKKCLQLTFDANHAVKNHKKLIFITERCVIVRDERGMVLEEVAPGVDVQRDILDQMEFTPVIPEGGPKLMPAEIFMEEWGNGGLKAIWDAKEGK